MQDMQLAIPDRSSYFQGRFFQKINEVDLDNSADWRADVGAEPPFELWPGRR